MMKFRKIRKNGKVESYLIALQKGDREKLARHFKVNEKLKEMILADEGKVRLYIVDENLFDALDKDREISGPLEASSEDVVNFFSSNTFKVVRNITNPNNPGNACDWNDEISLMTEVKH